MTLTFIVSIDINADFLELDARRHRKPVEAMTAALVADCEDRIDGALRYRDSVSRVGIELLQGAAKVNA